MRLQIDILTTLRLSLVLSVIFLDSCSKDQNNAGISDTESRIKKIEFDSSYVNIGPNTLNYADDKLVSMGNALDITYPAKNLVKVVERKNANQYSIYSYDDNNMLTKVEFTTPYFGQWPVNTFILHTSNNKVDSITNSVTGTTPIRALWKFKYDGNGNIVQIFEQFRSLIQVDTINFRYDNKPNLFQKNQLYFLIEFAFWGNELGNKAIPFLFSKNNVVYEKYTGYSNGINYNYKSDGQGRITELFYEPYNGFGWKFYY